MYSGRGSFGGTSRGGYGGEGGGSGGSGGPKPVKVGDEVDVTIEATASRGDGIAKKEGFVIFVKGATQGQSVRIKITDVRERFATGEVVGPAAGGSAPSEPAPEAGAEEPEEDSAPSE